MSADRLPPHPPAGMKRYTSVCRDPKDNPFKGSGMRRKTQTVDVDADTPRSQVELWAREAAEEAGLVFIELEPKN